MTTLCIEDAGTELRAAINITKANAQPRTREQCQLGMVRFHPTCNFHALMQLLADAGYRSERDTKGAIWIAPGEQQ